MRAVSKKRAKAAPANRTVRAAVFERDRYRCVLADLERSPVFMNKSGRDEPECAGELTPHHRRKASSAGAYSMENLLTLCVFHNCFVEDNPDVVRADYGTWLVVREGDPEWDSLGVRAQRESGSRPLEER